MTGKEAFDSYDAAGVVVAVELVNALAIGSGPVPHADAHAAIRRILEIDPPSVAQLHARNVPGFVTLAQRLGEVFAEVDRGDLDAAAGRLNDLLAAHPAHPHLAKEDGRWRVHHHPVDASVLPMWTAICAEGLARMLGAGEEGRLGTCDSPACARVFLDESRNASRRFCSTTCQNRVKAAAFRRRRAAGDT